jgi:hypothetical protein
VIERLNKLGDRMLARLLPRMNASACLCSPDPWQECDWIPGTACYAFGHPTLLYCSYNCNCQATCVRRGCC